MFDLERMYGAISSMELFACATIWTPGFANCSAAVRGHAFDVGKRTSLEVSNGVHVICFPRARQACFRMGSSVWALLGQVKFAANFGALWHDNSPHIWMND